MTDTDLLGDSAHSGVYRLPDEAAWVTRAAHAHGFVYWRIDLATVRDKSALLASIAWALEFPDWFGGNWDALQDCLGDLSWRSAPGYAIVLENCQAFAQHASEDFETALEVFGAAAEFWRAHGVPFWVFVGGVSEGRRDLPHINKRI